VRKKLWDNFAYFLERVVLSPPRPACAWHFTPMIRHGRSFGLPRIITSGSALDRVTAIVDDPANGITFCAGSLAADPRNDLAGIVRGLGSRGRIHFVHLRNSRERGALVPGDPAPRVSRHRHGF